MEEFFYSCKIIFKKKKRENLGEIAPGMGAQLYKLFQNMGIQKVNLRRQNMNAKRILGMIILIAGIIMIGFSFYIKKQVAEGNIEISSAQKNVDRGSSLFNLNPVAKEIGKGIIGSAQSKIDQGEKDVAYYTQLANGLQIGGIVCIAIGAAIIFIGRKRG